MEQMIARNCMIIVNRIAKSKRIIEEETLPLHEYGKKKETEIKVKSKQRILFRMKLQIAISLQLANMFQRHTTEVQRLKVKS